MNKAFEGRTVERINFLYGFSKLKNKTPFEHAEIRDVCRRAKQMNVWIKLRNLSSKKDYSQSLKLLTYREFNLCKFRAFRNSV
jgi:hypothetical protein